MDGGEGLSNRRLRQHYGTLALPTSGAGLEAAGTIEEVGETGDVLIVVDVVLVV
jgi:NADPH:quinone reductase-like Zn-dependent oxidoreductase